MGELFSPERLTLARQRRGYFVQELAARVNVSAKTVGAWERGDSVPKPPHLDALAITLEFPREFFFGDAPPVLEGSAFRSLARTTARQRDMARTAGSQAVALDAWIEERFTRPRPNVPDLSGRDPNTAALELRALWNLGYRPLPNLVHLMEANGIRVYSLVHKGDEIDALSAWQNDVPFVFLNTTKTAEHGRMDASHEIAHLTLHAHADEDRHKVHEDEARAFASAFMMPEAPFIATAPRRISVSAVVEAKHEWGVSALAYVYRLHQLGRLKDWQYRSLCIHLKSNYPKSEPGRPLNRETSQILAKVLLPPKEGGAFTRKDVARALSYSLRDIDDITFGLALTAVTGGDARPGADGGSSREVSPIKLMK